MTTTQDIRLADGRTVRVHDSAAPGSAGVFTVLWHTGSPQTGALLDPLLTAADARGIRLFSYGRPSYGGSSSHRGRTVGSAAADVEQIADALGVGRFATMGASGGGPHALACAALLPQRVSAVVSLAGLAPFGATGLDWFAGMASDGASLRAAVEGRAARERYEQTAEFDPTSFNARDYAALDGHWLSLGHDVAKAAADGPEGIIDDDLAFVVPWGFEVSSITAPVLLVHGGEDRVIPLAHSQWLLRNLDDAELWLRPKFGHVSILDAAPLAMDWLLASAV